uniref:Uncharacterized protein n=1 Tax=Romanomermis culicivorax TaxID=13658 RepID=A0A915IU33_ROMCU
MIKILDLVGAQELDKETLFLILFRNYCILTPLRAPVGAAPVAPDRAAPVVRRTAAPIKILQQLCDNDFHLIIRLKNSTVVLDGDSPLGDGDAFCWSLATAAAACAAAADVKLAKKLLAKAAA